MKIFWGTIIISTFLFAVTGCVPMKIEPQKTQLEIRELQTRSYTSKDLKLVMKAVINALQDDGFLIKSADKELGYISASKEVDVQDSTEAFFSQLFEGNAARYRKNSIIEASANISEFGKETKVRVVFQMKVIDNFGAPVETKQVEDPKAYQEFFAKVDKSVFFEREKI